MDYAPFTGMLKCLSDLASEVSGVIDAERPTIEDELPEIDPFDKFEDDVAPLLGFADVVNPGDIGMIKFRSALSLDPESPHRFRFAVADRDDFDGDDPVKALVSS